MQPPGFINSVVRSAQSGDEAAWSILYQLFYPKVYSTALRICGAMPETKDIVQDSFINAYLKLSQLKDTGYFESWIKKITERNCYRFLLRNRSKKQLYSLKFLHEDQLKQDIEFEFEKVSSLQKLYAVLAELSENLRVVVLLRYFTGFNSYHDIASVLRIPLGTVRSRLNEARQKLVEKWSLPVNPICNANENQEWNHFYFETFSNLHFNDSDKNRLFTHLGTTAKLFFPGGVCNIGYKAFENLVIDDKKHGSWLKPVQVMTCGNVSVIEVKHFNSPENPDHCPAKSVAVLHRQNKKVEKLNLHLATS